MAPLIEVRPGTLLWKAVSPTIAEFYLGNVIVPGRFEPTRLAGLVVPDSVVRGSIPGDIAAVHADSGSVYGDVYALRFMAGWPGLYTTNGEGRLSASLTELPVGAELIRIDADGDRQILGTYRNRREGWWSTGAVANFGPSGWRVRLAFPVTTVRHGLFARYRGGDYEADLGPDAAELTLIACRGDAVPFAVGAAECDSLAWVRLRTRWSGADFEVIDSRSDALTLGYLSGDRRRAHELGLTEVDLNVWRVDVMHADIAPPREEIFHIAIGRDW